jgi:hypothetical protein
LSCFTPHLLQKNSKYYTEDTEDNVNIYFLSEASAAPDVNVPNVKREAQIFDIINEAEELLGLTLATERQLMPNPYHHILPYQMDSIQTQITLYSSLLILPVSASFNFHPYSICWSLASQTLFLLMFTL